MSLWPNYSAPARHVPSYLRSYCLLFLPLSVQFEAYNVSELFQIGRMWIPEAKDWDLDLDKYINPYVPRNLVARLPKWISHFLGHRDSPEKNVGNILVAAWSFFGAFVGLMGIAAILEYNTVESPLAQPRNTIIGHFIGAVIGIGITKLFYLSPDFENLIWLAGALACGLASAVMYITNTVHPPAGATALLAVVYPLVEQLGRFLLPLVCLSTLLILVVSLLINNIQRQYPMYWWTPADLGNNKKTDDIETTPESPWRCEYPPSIEDAEKLMIKIIAHRIFVPEHVYLAQEELDILEVLQDCLRGLPKIPQPARTRPVLYLPLGFPGAY